MVVEHIGDRYGRRAALTFSIAAMAVQNALLHVGFARSPTTAVMTGNVVGATVSGVRLLVGGTGATPQDRAAWRRTWPLIVGFLAGCLVGGIACRLLGDLAALVPMAAAVVVAIMFGAARPGAVTTRSIVGHADGPEGAVG